TVHLVNKDTHVTMEKLRKLPFVPGYVWDEVDVDGQTPVDFTLSFGTGGEDVHYKVVTQPRQTKVFIPSIDLRAEDARGKVEVEDEVVRLRDVEGKAADGNLKVHGDLDFSTTPYRLVLHVDADKLHIDKLPKSWGLPETELFQRGTLTGAA